MINRDERTAPPGKFRLIEVDTFNNSDWKEDDFDDREEAIRIADMRGGTMQKMYVYDDEGTCIFQSGNF